MHSSTAPSYLGRGRNLVDDECIISGSDTAIPVAHRSVSQAVCRVKLTLWQTLKASALMYGMAGHRPSKLRLSEQTEMLALVQANKSKRMLHVKTV